MAAAVAAHAERRSAARVSHSALPDGLAARIRPGHIGRIVNAGARGALVEIRCRLPPGATVDVRFEGVAFVAEIRAVVARSYVSQLRANHILFRSALTFDRDVAWIGGGG